MTSSDPARGAVRAVAVYASARAGTPLQRSHARELGTLLAQSGITLVYGGGSRGLMGEMAQACGDGGGRVIGVTTPQVEKVEGARTVDLTERHVAASLKARREKMFDLADAVVAIPGGIGTLEELFEIWSARHLKLHSKPMALLNTEGFWSPLLAWMNALQQQGFVRPDTELQPSVHDDPRGLVLQLLGAPNEMEESK